ncbi:MAG: BLUF domain-containing protein [Pseudomonadota bacterium]
MEIFSLMYLSRSLVDPEGLEMREIALSSQRNNARRGLTGFLYYDCDTFLQVLEGPRAEVESVYDAIKRDSRHDRIHLIASHPILQRAFGGWSMGLYDGALDGGLLTERFGAGLIDRAQEADAPEMMRFLRDLSVGRDDIYALPSHG